jgi:hypothetical protein
MESLLIPAVFGNRNIYLSSDLAQGAVSLNRWVDGSSPSVAL